MQNRAVLYSGLLLLTSAIDTGQHRIDYALPQRRSNSRSLPSWERTNGVSPDILQLHRKSYTASARRITSVALSAWVASLSRSMLSLVASGISKFRRIFGWVRAGLAIVLSPRDVRHTKRKNDTRNCGPCYRRYHFRPRILLKRGDGDHDDCRYCEFQAVHASKQLQPSCRQFLQFRVLAVVRLLRF